MKKTVYALNWEKGKYEITSETEDKETIYRDLARDLIHKKLENRKDIVKICRKRTAAGEIEITMYHDNYGKVVYIVEA